MGEFPVDEIAVDHVLAVIQPIWLSKSETARRLQMRIAKVLAWATAKGLREGVNPAGWATLKHLLPPIERIRRVQHLEAVPYPELPQLMVNRSGAVEVLLDVEVTASELKQLVEVVSFVSRRTDSD